MCQWRNGLEEDRRGKKSVENTQTVAVLRLLIWAPCWQHEHRSWVALRGQRGSALGVKIPVPAGTVSLCLHTLAQQSRHSSCSAVQSHALQRRQEPCGDQRLWHLLVATIQGARTTGSAAQVPAPLHTHCRAGGSTAGKDTGTVGRTSRCVTRCDNTGHLALPPPAAPGAG